MEKLNIIELLRDCPTGMELDCTMFEDVHFDHISNCGEFIFCYINYEDRKTSISFNKYGAYSNIDKSKCVIFPKGKTTWEGFQRPFVEGDVVSTESGMYIGIVKSAKDNHECCTFCSIHGKKDFHVGKKLFFSRLATKEEKQIMFDISKANGYHWNPETKTLEKLPKFKVGDRIRRKNNTTIIKTIGYIYSDSYALYDGRLLYFKEQDEWELAPNKFDTNTLKPFDKVLVRNTNNGKWCGQFYMDYNKNEDYPFECTYNCWKYCIPYEGNEHLRGTTDECSNYYKTWKE